MTVSTLANRDYIWIPGTAKQSAVFMQTDSRVSTVGTRVGAMT